jgi:RNA polymerase sigma factor (TIGR02999 family)
VDSTQPNKSEQVTRILQGLRAGTPSAAGELLPLVYDELRQIARYKLSREKPGQTLQATALVHEAWLRLVGSEQQNWQGGNYFFVAAAETMRGILVENARRKCRLKRSGKWARVDVEGLDTAAVQPV